MDITHTLARALIFWAAAGLLATLIGMWITYLVIKAAIRDGIKESGLVDAIRRQRPIETGGALPRMRAER